MNPDAEHNARVEAQRRFNVEMDAALIVARVRPSASVLQPLGVTFWEWAQWSRLWEPLDSELERTP